MIWHKLCFTYTCMYMHMCGGVSWLWRYWTHSWQAHLGIYALLPQEMITGRVSHDNIYAWGKDWSPLPPCILKGLKYQPVSKDWTPKHRNILGFCEALYEANCRRVNHFLSLLLLDLAKWYCIFYFLFYFTLLHFTLSYNYFFLSEYLSPFSSLFITS